MSEAEERLLLLRQLEELRLERDACTTINRVAMHLIFTVIIDQTDTEKTTTNESGFSDFLRLYVLVPLL